MTQLRFRALATLLVAGALLAGAATAQTTASTAAPAPAANSRNYAPGFSTRAAGSRLVIVPTEMELFSISAGGVQEPRADWTAAAQKHFAAALETRRPLLGANVTRMSEGELDALAEINALHGAVAQAVFFHHFLGQKLPTKNGVLDWSMGDAVAELKQKTGADYALFTWIHDSYASNERKAAMVAMAMLGVGLTAGTQIGYASLVDLGSGRIVWFNSSLRATGDLREAAPALETLDTLLKDFPRAQ